VVRYWDRDEQAVVKVDDSLQGTCRDSAGCLGPGSQGRCKMHPHWAKLLLESTAEGQDTPTRGKDGVRSSRALMPRLVHIPELGQNKIYGSQTALSSLLQSEPP